MLNNNSANIFQIGFKLFHVDGIQSVFYKGRNIEDDFQKIFDLIQFDSLFIQHKSTLKIEKDANSCIISIENFGFSADKAQADETVKFIRLAIQNKLMYEDLYDHFYINFCSQNSRPLSNTTVCISYQNNQLKHVIKGSRNARELEKLKFPEQHIPANFCCILTSELIDIPCVDAKNEDNVYNQTSFILHLRQNNSTNPLTKLYVETPSYRYDVWDHIETFMNKIRLLHEKNLDYQIYMQYILDERISVIELKEKLEKDVKELASNAEEIEALAKKYYQGHEYTNALYLFQKVVTQYSQAKSAKLNGAKLYYAICLLKFKNYDLAIPLCDDLMKQNNMLQDSAWIVMLIHFANYQLAKSSYDFAKELISDAYKLAQKQMEPTIFPHWQMEFKLLQKLRILTEMKCPNTTEGHQKALRNIAANNRLDLLQIFFDFIDIDPDRIDRNPKKGYTALHWAIENNHIECAWMLEIYGCRFDIKSASWQDDNNIIQGGKTAKDLILQSNSKELKALLNPYFSLEIELVSNDNEEALTKKITEKLPYIAQILGFSENTQLIYISHMKKIVVSPGCIPSKMSHEITDFFGNQIALSPILNQLFKLKNLTQLENQPNLLKPCNFYLQFSKILTQGQASRLASSNQFHLFSQTSSNTIVNFLLRSFARLGLNINVNQANVSNNQANLLIQVNLKCMFYDDLSKFLKYYLQAQLSLANLGFNCDSILILDSQPLPQSNYTPQV